MYSQRPSYWTKPNDISDPYETKSTARTLNDTAQVRERRGFGNILVQAILGLITLAIESASSYIKGRQQQKINEAFLCCHFSRNTYRRFLLDLVLDE